MHPEIEFHVQFTPFKKVVVDSEELEVGDLTHVTTLYICGVGKFFPQIQNWLEKSSSHAVVVLEEDLGALDAFLKIADGQPLWRHPQVYVKFVSSTEMWDGVLEECAREFPYDQLEVCGYRRYAKRVRHIKLKLQRKTVLWNAALAEELLAPLFHKNILANMAHISSAFYANLWRDTFHNVPALICGAGPSLADAQDVLRRCGNQALIFGGGSAIAALSHMQITPHFAVAIDPNPQEYEHLKNLTCPETPLIFSSRLLPKARQLFSGPLGYLSSKTGGSLEAFLEERLNLKEAAIGPDLGREALSVTTLATSLAYAWGCNPLIFVGVDMAYRDQKMYAEGVSFSRHLHGKRVCDEQLMRKNTQGKRVSTLVKWVMESETLSQYAQDHPDRLFFNASPKGLGFKHIPNKDLSEILNTYSSNRSLTEEIGKKITETKIMSGDIGHVFTELLESLKRCLVLTEKLMQEEQLESGLKTILTYDLQEEVAYAPMLEGTLWAFEHARKKSFLIPQDPQHAHYLERALCFEKAKWNHLKTCIEEELISLADSVQACCVTYAD